MARIGPIKLAVDIRGAESVIDVKYNIVFDHDDRESGAVYREICRLIGDDTNVGDPPQAGADDTLGFLTPLFTRDAAPPTGSLSLPRHFHKTFRTGDLDEDRGPIPNPDEIRALVTLAPEPANGDKPVSRQSNLVRKTITQGPAPTPPPDPTPTPPPGPSCGAEISADTTLEADLTCPNGPALIIAADNVTLDLGGYAVSGNRGGGSSGPGIVLRNVSGVTVRNGTVQHFGAGIVIVGGANNTIQNVTVQDNIGSPDGDFGDGIVLDKGTTGNHIMGNTVRRNGPFSGISLLEDAQNNHIHDNTVADNNMLHVGDPAAGRQTMGIRVEGPAANGNRIFANTVTASGANGIGVLATCTNPDATPPCTGSPPNEGNQIASNTSNGNGTSGRGSGITLFTMPNPVPPARNSIVDNVADNNRTDGVSIDQGSTGNDVRRNRAHGNGETDGYDGNTTPPCGANVWESNEFGMVNQPCVRGRGGIGGEPIAFIGARPAPA
ncbi:MAG: right-handed parallel beta-helix repeat-containing protein [Actinomycetota bacterium]|nr:right-handed parallel beta-helix repeat-containing protein [Actinomycetota bacterium]